MEKTKLGLPVSIVIAGTYLLVHFGGWIPALLLLGFVLLYEDNKVLKISAVTAVALALAFSLLIALVGLIPGMTELLSTFVRFFDEYYYSDLSTKIYNFLYNLLSLGKTVLFVLLAVFATMDKPIQPAFVKRLFD